MGFTSRSYAESLLKLAESATKKEIPAIVDQFIKFLIKERQFKFAQQIIEQIENAIRGKEGRVEVTVVGAHALDAGARQAVADFLRQPVETVEFQEKVDKNLLGGVRIRLHDLLVDATITGQLERLREQLR